MLDISSTTVSCAETSGARPTTRIVATLTQDTKCCDWTLIGTKSNNLSKYVAVCPQETCSLAILLLPVAWHIHTKDIETR